MGDLFTSSKLSFSSSTFAAAIVGCRAERYVDATWPEPTALALLVSHVGARSAVQSYAVGRRQGYIP